MDERSSLLSLTRGKLSPLVLKLLRGTSHEETISFHFAQLNGELHWALYAKNRNLLEPKINDFVYLVLIASSLRALHEHAPLLWATIASAENDRCLDLAQFHLRVESPIDQVIPIHKNRPGLFALDRNGWIVRCAPPDLELTVAVIQAILADSLQLILDEISDWIQDRKLTNEELLREARPLLQKHIDSSLPIEGRGEKAFHAFSVWKEKKTLRVFENIMSEEALHRLYEMKVKEYVQAMEKEWKEMKTIPEEIKKLEIQTVGLGWEAKGRVFCELIAPKMEKI